MAKIKIRKAPLGVPNQNPPGFDTRAMQKPAFETGRVLKSVPRDQANIEAESGETALMPNKGGLPAHFNIQGSRHTGGGTPLNVPEDTFIFSDTKKMRIKDPEILAEFGKSKGSYTPADLAKKYDINKYRKLLQDPDSDKLQVETAEKMIENYNLKLAKLALVQESKKGFPQGIPAVAMPFLASYNVEPDQILPLKEPEEQSIPQMRFGGSLPKAQEGMTLPTASTYANMPLGPDDLQRRTGFWEGVRNTENLPSNIAAGLIYGNNAKIIHNLYPYGQDRMATLGQNLPNSIGWIPDLALAPSTFIPVGKGLKYASELAAPIKPFVGKALDASVMLAAKLKDYSKIFGIEVAQLVKNKQILATIKNSLTSEFGLKIANQVLLKTLNDPYMDQPNSNGWIPTRSAKTDATLVAPPMIGPMDTTKIPVRINSIPQQPTLPVYTQPATQDSNQPLEDDIQGLIQSEGISRAEAIYVLTGK